VVHGTFYPASTPKAFGMMYCQSWALQSAFALSDTTLDVTSTDETTTNGKQRQ